MPMHTSRGPLRQLAAQFLCFGVVGIVGFAIDVAVLSLGLAFGLDLYSGRAVSYVFAATGTWYGNRLFTFRNRRSPRPLGEWLRFLTVNLPGGAVNYGVYAVLVTHFPLFAAVPAFAVALGALSGMIANFIGSWRIAFVHRA